MRAARFVVAALIAGGFAAAASLAPALGQARPAAPLAGPAGQIVGDWRGLHERFGPGEVFTTKKGVSWSDDQGRVWKDDIIDCDIVADDGKACTLKVTIVVVNTSTGKVSKTTKTVTTPGVVSYKAPQDGHATVYVEGTGDSCDVAVDCDVDD